jgi:hypothetical protein
MFGRRTALQSGDPAPRMAGRAKRHRNQQFTFVIWQVLRALAWF